MCLSHALKNISSAAVRFHTPWSPTSLRVNSSLLCQSLWLCTSLQPRRRLCSSSGRLYIVSCKPQWPLPPVSLSACSFVPVYCLSHRCTRLSCLLASLRDFSCFSALPADCYVFLDSVLYMYYSVVSMFVHFYSDCIVFWRHSATPSWFLVFLPAFEWVAPHVLVCVLSCDWPTALPSVVIGCLFHSTLLIGAQCSAILTSVYRWCSDLFFLFFHILFLSVPTPLHSIFVCAYYFYLLCYFTVACAIVNFHGSFWSLVLIFFLSLP